MTKLEIAGKGFANNEAFLRRQSRPSTTNAQTVFDVLFGIVAPILCFIIDPGILRSGILGWGLGLGFDLDRALFPDYAAFIYIASGLEILLLTIWLAWGRRLQSATHLAGGILMVGAIFSGLIGVVLLPFTLLGLVLGIGVFGFVPFLTALVYRRNAKSAFQLAAKSLDQPGSPGRPYEARSPSGVRSSLVATLGGCVLLLGPPAVLSIAASVFVSQAMNVVLSADEKQADLAIDEIGYLRFFAHPQLDRLVSAYNATNEPARKEELKRRYLKLTGRDIEQRAAVVIND